jgi:hypothetical protein
MLNRKIRNLTVSAVTILSATTFIALGATGASAATSAADNAGPGASITAASAAATRSPETLFPGTRRTVLAVPAAGAILCTPDICIQNDGYGPNTVAISAWAYDANLFGHFEMREGSYAKNSKTQTWPAGADAHTFLMPLQCTYSYTGTAWLDKNGEHYDGSVTVGLSVCQP